MPSDTGSIRVIVQVENFLSGGLENIVLDSIGGMQANGLDCVLLVLGKKGKAFREARRRGYKTFSEKYSDKTYLAFLEKWSPDIAIIHYSTSGTDLLREKSVPVIEVIHNAYVWFDETWLEQYSNHSNNVNKFVAVSNFVKEYSIRQLGLDPAKMTVINNPISMKVFDGRTGKPKARKPGSRFEFLMLASINHQKNHLGALRAFALLHHEFPGAQLVITGPRHERQLYSQIRAESRRLGIQRKVKLRGPTSCPHKSLQKADALLLPSFFEGGQLTLVEALYCATPVVASAVGYVRDFEDFGGVFAVEPPEPVMELRKPVAQFQSNHDFEVRLSNAMRALMLNYRSPDIPMSHFEKFLPSHAYKAYAQLARELVEAHSLKKRGV